MSAASAGIGACAPDGLVLLSANVWMPRLEPSRRMGLKKGLRIEAFGLIARLRGHFPSRRLRMGPADEAVDYVLDLRRFWRRDAWRSKRGADWLRGLASFDAPVLAVVGKGDELMAHHAGARRWAENFPRVTFWLVGRGDHGLAMDPDHIGLGADPRCRPLWVAIEGWMRTALHD